jgi:hypothetical protein
MIRLALIGVTILFALTLSTFASPLPPQFYRNAMPKELRGTWCRVVGPNPASVWKRGSKHCTDPNYNFASEILTITAEGYATDDDHCEHVKLIVYNPKRPRSFDVKFMCAHDENLGPDRKVFSSSKGPDFMIIMTLRLSGDRLITKPQ